MSTDSKWYPFGRDIRPTADYSLFDYRQRKWFRIPEHVASILNDELEELHVVMWDQLNDKSNYGAGVHIELCAFGGDGVASCKPLAEWIDVSFQGHTIPRGGGLSELSALVDLRDKLNVMIADRERHLKGKKSD